MARGVGEERLDVAVVNDAAQVLDLEIGRVFRKELELDDVQEREDRRGQRRAFHRRAISIMSSRRRGSSLWIWVRST